MTPGKPSCDQKCERCRVCHRFRLGDCIELSPTGVLVLGLRAVSRGIVTGQAALASRPNVGILVRWNGYSAKVVSTVDPKYLQKVFDTEKAFI